MVVDHRQMELFVVSGGAPTASVPAPARFPADLFEACQVQELRPKPIATPKVEPPLPSANNELDGEAQALAAIADLLIDLWREATGDDLRSSLKMS